MNQKPRLSFFQIWNMSFGFLGIQFGFALQGAFMSRIFQSLGAAKDDIPFLWLAAPLTGLIVQPIVGYLSDKTWHPRLGRRRPYFLIGAVLASITLFFVPHSPVLWVAAGCLWILDASINISMEPFRALVADKLPNSQRSYGFVVQTLIIGIGTWVASQLPFVLSQLGLKESLDTAGIPLNVQVAFAIGAFVFLVSILYTIFTTSEYPPEDLDKPEEDKDQAINFTDIFKNVIEMPVIMRKLGVVQFFSWFAFFTMWAMATPALTEHIFNAPAPDAAVFDLSIPSQEEAFNTANAKFNNAADLVGVYMGTYGLTSMFFALILTFITSRIRINRKFMHLACLFAGGLGFISMFFIENHQHLHLSFGLIGIAWASILSMPYAMLSSSIDPKKMGVFMGIFNMFICIPQICAGVGGINFLYKNIFGPATINTMLLAGSFLFLAGLANLLITEKSAISDQADE